VSSFLQGYNSTVFAFGKFPCLSSRALNWCAGQTGSGKTWTIHGDVKNPQNAGIAWRVAQQITQHVEVGVVCGSARLSCQCM
jgi:hypothetical protein